MKRIVFYSGGIGSWGTAKRVIKKHGKENVILLFTDTLIEDEDLYRFLDETVAEMGVEYIRLEEGRTPWEVFKDVRYLGNSRIAQCSHILKQEIAEKWIYENYNEDECILYLGIDWTEAHRTIKTTENWLPYTVKFPMCNEPYVSKDELLEELNLLGIKTPRLYTMGFSHNNCGGFCVRAGQAHFKNLLEQKPDLYKYHEQKEQEMREFLDKDISILRRQIKGVKYRLTLKQLREEIEQNNLENIDLDDFGGCGCMVQELEGGTK